MDSNHRRRSRRLYSCTHRGMVAFTGRSVVPGQGAGGWGSSRSDQTERTSDLLLLCGSHAFGAHLGQGRPMASTVARQPMPKLTSVGPTVGQVTRSPGVRGCRRVYLATVVQLVTHWRAVALSPWEVASDARLIGPSRVEGHLGLPLSARSVLSPDYRGRFLAIRGAVAGWRLWWWLARAGGCRGRRYCR
jgi:hypothetical protein